MLEAEQAYRRNRPSKYVLATDLISELGNHFALQTGIFPLLDMIVLE
jgi:hypothetical protein